MCRLLGYLGAPVQLDRLLNKPDHSLIVQSYQPKEMTAGLLNADGFGIGWYATHQEAEPYTYRNILPIWSDVNLPSLSRYVKLGCMLANVRSATPGFATDLSNCQPFQHQQLLGLHNGFIDKFQHTLCRPIRDRLSDTAYAAIRGTTDSEHIFALLIDQVAQAASLTAALHQTLIMLSDLGQAHQTHFSANVVVSDGQQLVASRFAHGVKTPTLYWLRDDPMFPEAVLIASEPLFAGNWHACPDRSLLTVTHDLDIQTTPI